VGIVELDKSVTFGFDIFPICLPKVAITDENKWKGLPATITGYGSKTGVDTSTLHYAKLSVLEHQDCTKKHYDDLIASNTEESMELQERVQVFLSEEKFTSELICSMASKEVLGTCPGDSGGPLVHYNEKNGMNFQIGVVFGSLQVKFRHYCLVRLDLKKNFLILS
jgi:secreted trypsin-like serine protease